MTQVHQPPTTTHTAIDESAHDAGAATSTHTTIDERVAKDVDRQLGQGKEEKKQDISVMCPSMLNFTTKLLV